MMDGKEAVMYEIFWVTTDEKLVSWRGCYEKRRCMKKHIEFSAS
ncbi:MAG: hypothetical protein QXK24_08010 [Ignisphaera sp.]